MALQPLEIWKQQKSSKRRISSAHLRIRHIKMHSVYYLVIHEAYSDFPKDDKKDCENITFVEWASCSLFNKCKRSTLNLHWNLCFWRAFSVPFLSLLIKIKEKGNRSGNKNALQMQAVFYKLRFDGLTLLATVRELYHCSVVLFPLK